MDTLAAFLITLGVVGMLNTSGRESLASGPQELNPIAATETAAASEEPGHVDPRRRRIELVNAWLRNLRHIAPAQSGPFPTADSRKPESQNPPG